MALIAKGNESSFVGWICTDDLSVSSGAVVDNTVPVEYIKDRAYRPLAYYVD